MTVIVIDVFTVSIHVTAIAIHQGKQLSTKVSWARMIALGPPWVYKNPG